MTCAKAKVIRSRNRIIDSRAIADSTRDYQSTYTAESRSRSSIDIGINRDTRYREGTIHIVNDSTNISSYITIRINNDSIGSKIITTQIRQDSDFYQNELEKNKKYKFEKYRNPEFRKSEITRKTNY